jgi:hypothetical protein
MIGLQPQGKVVVVVSIKMVHPEKGYLGEKIMASLLNMSKSFTTAKRFIHH